MNDFSEDADQAPSEEDKAYRFQLKQQKGIAHARYC